jgi:hypothetical protein
MFRITKPFSTENFFHKKNPGVTIKWINGPTGSSISGSKDVRPVKPSKNYVLTIEEAARIIRDDLNQHICIWEELQEDQISDETMIRNPRTYFTFLLATFGVLVKRPDHDEPITVAEAMKLIEERLQYEFQKLQ